MMNHVLLAAAEIPHGNPITFDGINSIVGTLVGFITTIAGFIMVIAIVLSGLMLIWSRGDPGRFKTGREMLRTSIIGSAVVLGVGLILNLLTQTFEGGFSLEPIQNFIWDVTSTLGDFIVSLSVVVMITFIVISGMMMATAGSDEGKFKKGRQMLINTIWGSLVILGVGVILNTINAVVTGDFFCRLSVIGICIFS